MLGMAKKRTPAHPEDEQPRRKPGRKPAQRSGAPVALWLDDELTAALQAYIDAQDVPPDKSAVLRTGLRLFLQQKGFLPSGQHHA